MTHKRTIDRAARPRRRWTIALIIAAVVAVVALGTWAIIAATGRDSAAIAADLADDFITEANNNDDGEAAAALFTEDGVVTMPNGRVSHGRAEIVAHVNDWSSTTDSWVRVSDVVKTEAGAFRFTARGNWEGDAWEGEGEIELDGDLIARFTWFGAHLLAE